MLDLNAIEQRANAATPGPWEQAWHAQRKPICLITNGAKFGIYGNAPCDYQHDDDANGDFIAAARSDIPALIARVRELERIVEESIVSGSELVVGQYILIRERMAYDEFGYTATAINGEHRPTSLEPKLDLWEAMDQARRWSMVPPPGGNADGK